MTATNTTSLVGQRVTVRANDFVDAPTSGYVRLVDPATNSVLIDLDVPLERDGVLYTRAIACPRLTRDNLGTLISQSALHSAVTWVPEARYDPRSPFDLSWWRGGAAGISDIVLV